MSETTTLIEKAKAFVLAHSLNVALFVAGLVIGLVL